MKLDASMSKGFLVGVRQHENASLMRHSSSVRLGKAERKLFLALGYDGPLRGSYGSTRPTVLIEFVQSAVASLKQLWTCTAARAALPPACQLKTRSSLIRRSSSSAPRISESDAFFLVCASFYDIWYSADAMLISQGRGPRVIAGVAATLTLLLLLLWSTSSSPSQWKLPSTSWNRPLTADPPEKDLTGEDSWEIFPIQHETTIRPSSTPTTSQTPQTTHTVAGAHITATGLPCQSLSGSDDVIVVMRTGATEIKDKLPIHFNTTFQCYPDIVIFSDFEEVYDGYKVHDVLKHIPDDIRNTHKDFKHYQHILSAGRKGLDESELSGAVSEETGGAGKGDNPGWSLDKWKFLPMMNETFIMYPDKKWYVFVETDSYLVWSNFLQWLPKLDATTAAYFGSEVMAGDDLFAHGGSVFLLTNPAMEVISKAYNTDTKALNAYTGGHWAGDAVLGKTLKDHGVDLTFTWPQFQGNNPSLFRDWESTKGDKKLWCVPVLSYHHLLPYEVADMWQFEQGWIEDVKARLIDRGGSDTQTLLHHQDMFKTYIMPNLTKEREDWDAQPDDKASEDVDMTKSKCKALCEGHSGCMQYAFGPKGCATGGVPRMGQPAQGVTSGWLFDRVEKWVEKMDQSCSNPDWTTPS